MNDPIGKDSAGLAHDLRIAGTVLAMFLPIAMLFVWPSFPDLDELTPVRAAIVSTQRHANSFARDRATARRSLLRMLGHHEQRVRLGRVAVEFVINGDHFGSFGARPGLDTSLGLAVGDVVTLWARRAPPDNFSPLWSKSKYENHAIPAATSSGLPRFEVVQLDAGGRRLLEYAAMRRTVTFKQRAFYVTVILLYLATTAAVMIFLKPSRRGSSAGVRVNITTQKRDERRYRRD
jgi:hypothetical protein